VESNIIFRNDDVCKNTNIFKLKKVYDVLTTYFSDCRIINCINVISRKTNRGSVYDEVPFKDNPVKWFYDINQFMDKELIEQLPFEKASHGLFHVDHTKIHRDTQLMSIMGSTSYIGTTMFMPPFARWNEDTQSVCRQCGIKLLTDGRQWKSLEFEKFDPEHKFWYFHSWRFDQSTMRKVLDGHCINMAKL